MALVLGALALVLALLAVVEPVENSWRIGVDESERTELVTSGPFGAGEFRTIRERGASP